MSNLLDQPLLLIGWLFFLAILPLIIVVGTSFLKLAITFSLLRNALGIQSVPPNMAIYGLALVLTLFIMAPVGMAINDNLTKQPLSMEDEHLYQTIDSNILLPYKKFLQTNTNVAQMNYFSNIGNKIWPAEYKEKIAHDSLVVLLPAFCISQIVEAFKIGLLLYLPFIAIDLIVSNILLAMGMMMVSPTTISLPFKLLVFILAGGWQELTDKLVLSFL
jgi:type III secretion protein R